MTADTKPFFFVHVQKAAGTSLLFRLRREFGREAIYPPQEDKGDVGATIVVEHLQRRWRESAGSIRVITGHFPLCTTEVLGGGFTTFTVLRDPVERTLSYLRHHRKMTPSEADRPLEDIYDDPFRFHGMIHNHMVKMFSLAAAEMTDGMLTRVEFTPERLERAKANLRTVDAVGVEERFGEFCDELAQRFGWDLGEPAHVNRTEPVEVSDSFRRRIAEDNAMDGELFELARRIDAERRAAWAQADQRTRGTCSPG